MPGTPFTYHSEEIGMSGNKPDEKLRNLLAWSAEPNGGFSTGQPWEPLRT